jgi:hypothetical protein
MNPKSHRLYHCERDADTARLLARSDLARAVRRPPSSRSMLLRVLAGLRRQDETAAVTEGVPEAPPARAPR